MFFIPNVLFCNSVTVNLRLPISFIKVNEITQPIKNRTQSGLTKPFQENFTIGDKENKFLNVSRSLRIFE